MNKDAWIDLHLHSDCSDGLLCPSDVVQKAKEIGLCAISIVDHDTIVGIPKAIEEGRKLGIEVITGVELSSQYQGKDIHILGYLFDVGHSRMLKYLERFRKERYRRAVKMIQNLENNGIHMSISEVLQKTNNGSIGRPHLAEILMEKGYVETFQEAFDRYIGYGSKAYEEKYKIKPEDAIALISEAGGLSFLAHPGYHITDEIIRRLIKAGLDGIEVVHPNLMENRSLHLQQIAREYDLLISGGSDCHGGRNGTFLIGRYNLPYVILEQIKNVHQTRWGVSIRKVDEK